MLVEEADIINNDYIQEDTLTKNRGGGSHDYLGMTIKQSDSGKVYITMPNYIEGLLEDTPASLLGESDTTTEIIYLKWMSTRIPLLKRRL